MKIVLILLFLLVILAVPGLYWYAISGGEFKFVPLSEKNQDWAALGSYIGGVLGPVLSAASILFVWKQSKDATAKQQVQLEKLNEQLGLEKRNMFRDEFIRLMSRAEQRATEYMVIPMFSSAFDRPENAIPIEEDNGLAYDFRATFADVSVLRKQTFDYNDDYEIMSETNLALDQDTRKHAWEELKPYMLHVFELADFLQNQFRQYDLSDEFLAPYKRQFRDTFYPEGKEDLAWIKLLMDDESLHSYKNLSEILER